MDTWHVKAHGTCTEAIKTKITVQNIAHKLLQNELLFTEPYWNLKGNDLKGYDLSNQF